MYKVKYQSLKDGDEKTYEARDYQSKAFHNAVEHYKNKKTIYVYDSPGIEFQLVPCRANTYELGFTMIRLDYTFGFLFAKIPQYEQRIAIKNMEVPYAGSHVNVAVGSKYYTLVDNGATVVGWHGSVNPPCDMDGNPFISSDDFIVNNHKDKPRETIVGPRTR